VDTFDVLTLAGVAAKPAVPGGIQLRHLCDDADWLASAELAAQIAIEEGYDPAIHTPFLTRRNATRRKQIADGLGDWFGAFDGDLLVGQMGMFHDATVARFQSVETRASHRRRGICAALLGHVSGWAAARAPQATQVIVAEADSDAGRLYRWAGFTHSEILVEAGRAGY
jgi:GNAT superfamily N-acetyltransferase